MSRVTQLVVLVVGVVWCLMASPLLALAENQDQVCELTNRTWKGHASYYSTNGCLGCNRNKRMANGEILDDSKFTLAFMRLPLDSWVRVTNLDNGISARAKVTDRGGFEPYGRIADLSLSLSDYLDMETDSSVIEVAELSCQQVTDTPIPETPLPEEDPVPSSGTDMVRPSVIDILGAGFGGGN